MTDGVHNGAMCRKCFTTIDLTELRKSSPASITPEVGSRDSLLTRRDPFGHRFFDVTCPFCGGGCTFNYDEVRQLETWKEAEERLDKRLETVEHQFEDPHFKADLAKKLVDEIENREKVRGK